MWPLLRSLIVPPPAEIRAMGFPREVAGIRGRYLRRRVDWEPHLERSRRIVLAGAERASDRRKAVILGGGLEHDVPLAELAAMFREVILVDVLHPFGARWRTRGFPNVRRVVADVTGTLREAYRIAWDAHLPLPTVEPGLFLDDPELDFTASVNLLSQLPCMPTDYLKSQGAHAQERIDAYARGLIAAHLRYLARLPGAVTLITDVERVKLTRTGEVVERRDLLLGELWPDRGEEWEWRLAPWPEADPSHSYFRGVRGVADWK